MLSFLFFRYLTPYYGTLGALVLLVQVLVHVQVVQVLVPIQNPEERPGLGQGSAKATMQKQPSSLALAPVRAQGQQLQPGFRIR